MHGQQACLAGGYKCWDRWLELDDRTLARGSLVLSAWIWGRKPGTLMIQVCYKVAEGDLHGTGPLAHIAGFWAILFSMPLAVELYVGASLLRRASQSKAAVVKLPCTE